MLRVGIKFTVDNEQSYPTSRSVWKKVVIFIKFYTVLGKLFPGGGFSVMEVML